MKKVLASFVAVGLMATVANAEYIGLRWAADHGSNTAQGGTVEVVVRLTSDEGFIGTGVAGLGFEFSGANATTPVAPNLRVSNFATSINDWDANDSNPGLMATPGVAFGVSGNQILVGAGEYVLGTFDVTWDGPNDGLTKPFTALIPQHALGLITAEGGKYTWNANVAAGGPVADGVYTYQAVAFAADLFGNPGWGSMAPAGHQPTPNPLFVTKVPEPTSLALVALGGFALLRRRN